MSIAECPDLTVNPVKVALWCAPRTMSTVLTKCLSYIDGLDVYNELFTYAHAFRGTFSTATGRTVPMSLEGNEAVYEEAIDLWEKNTGGRLYPNRVAFHSIKRDLENASESRYVLIKEMAYVVEPFHRDYIPTGFRHTFLIREPSRTLLSWKKTNTTNFPNMYPDYSKYNIIRDDPWTVRPLGWYEAQCTLWRYFKKTCKEPPVVIDASDLATHPKETLQAYCKAVGLPFTESLLTWETRTTVPKNFIMAGPNVFNDLFNFYQRAFSTTQFVAPSKETSVPIPRDQLPDDVLQCVDRGMPFYEEMYRERLRVC